MVVIRPMQLKDAGALRAFIERLSPASRLARFQHVVKEATPRLLRLLLEVDPRNHVVLGAFDGAAMVGEARYVRRKDPAEADFAIAVDAAWRGSGLYTQLWAMHLLPLALAASFVAMRSDRANSPASCPRRRPRGRNSTTSSSASA